MRNHWIRTGLVLATLLLAALPGSAQKPMSATLMEPGSADGLVFTMDSSGVVTVTRVSDGLPIAAFSVALDATTVSADTTITAGSIGVGGTVGSWVLCNGLNPGACTTLTQAEVAMLDGITAGTGAAGKALVLNSGSDITVGIDDLAAEGPVTVGLDVAGGAPNTAGQIKLWSAGDNAFYMTITPGVQTQSINYTMPVDDGTASQVLQTNGAGVLSWATVSAAEADTLATVTARGATTAVASIFNGGISGNLSGNVTGSASKLVKAGAAPVNAVAAQGTMDLTGVPAPNDILQIGAQVYTWLDSRAVAGEVAVGTDHIDSGTNLAVAVNVDSANTNATDNLDGTVTITADTPGAAGNAIVLTETSNHLTVDGAGTLGATTLGADAVKAKGTMTFPAGIPNVPESFTVGALTYEWVETRAGAGEVTVGADHTASAVNAEAAIDLDSANTTAAVVGDTVVVTADTPGAAGNAIAFSDSSTNVAVDGAGTLGATTAGADAIKAQGTVTFPGGLPIVNETITIGTGEVYRWKALANDPFEVTIGADEPGCVTNLVAVITADSTVADALDGALDTVTVTAKVAGASGNTIVFEEASSNVTVDGTGFLGTTTAGADAVAAQGTMTFSVGPPLHPDSFVVDTQLFEWRVLRAAAGQVTIGADAPGCVTNAVTAIDTDLATVDATDGALDTVEVEAITAGAAGNAIAFTENTTNMTVDGAGTLGATVLGADAVAAQGTVTITVDNPHPPERFTIDDHVFQWRTLRAVHGEVTIGGNAPDCVTNIAAAVTADLPTVAALDAAGDTVTITAVTKGVIGNAIVFTEATSNLTVNGAGTLGATILGVDGTVGGEGDVVWTASYLYLCTAANTIADNNWRRVSLGTAY